MAEQEIVLWPDLRLTEVCVPVEEVDLTLLADMFETMYAAPGRGLAAPQIGVMRRVFVMDPTWKDGVATPYVCINPEITARSDAQVTGAEACLSIPGVEAEIARAETITLRYQDAQMRMHENNFSGFAAACAQHELDHLDGKVIFDRLSTDESKRLQAAYA
ncbi:MAG: peptide deformylase [Marinovum sp.]|nr:peptide deformylase [Marinovum sp.]